VTVCKESDTQCIFDPLLLTARGSQPDTSRWRRLFCLGRWSPYLYPRPPLSLHHHELQAAVLRFASVHVVILNGTLLAV